MNVIKATTRRRIRTIINGMNYHPDRYRFNTLHELGHYFAGAMLLDKRAIEQELGLKRKQISLQELISLKNSTEFRFSLLRKGISPFPKRQL